MTDTEPRRERDASPIQDMSTKEVMDLVKSAVEQGSRIFYEFDFQDPEHPGMMWGRITLWDKVYVCKLPMVALSAHLTVILPGIPVGKDKQSRQSRQCPLQFL